MRNLTVVLLALLCIGCGLGPSPIEKAPLESNEAVVFDIDGTLTPRPIRFLTPRDDAARAVGLYADQGYKIVYLTARTQILQNHIPGWLEKNQFPDGSLHVAQTKMHWSDPRAFKKGILDSYRQNGWIFVAAYGDSTTDFEAYAEFGIKKKRVFALQREGNDSCRKGVWEKCLGSWTEQIDRIKRNHTRSNQ